MGVSGRGGRPGRWPCFRLAERLLDLTNARAGAPGSPATLGRGPPPPGASARPLRGPHGSSRDAGRRGGASRRSARPQAGIAATHTSAQLPRPRAFTTRNFPPCSVWPGCSFCKEPLSAAATLEERQAPMAGHLQVAGAGAKVLQRRETGCEGSTHATHVTGMGALRRTQRRQLRPGADAGSSPGREAARLTNSAGCIHSIPFARVLHRAQSGCRVAFGTAAASTAMPGLPPPPAPPRRARAAHADVKQGQGIGPAAVPGTYPCRPAF